MVDKKEVPVVSEELDCVIEAGKILMESGAEIYRIEDTMNYMAKSLQVGDFKAYVVNRGIIATGNDRSGDNEARVIAIPETSIHLGKIEAVNSLSRRVEDREILSTQEIELELQRIAEMKKPRMWTTVLAYFIGAGCFSYAIGSTVLDSLSSAIVGLLMGLVLEWTGNFINTKVLRTILGSAVVALAANLLCLCGFGQNRGLVILGALMVIVPGAVFTNSVREFSQNNHITGLILLMSALLTCLSISCGVALTVELLPFAEHRMGAFSLDVDSLWEVAARTVMAGVGTIAFSFLFHAPKKYFPDLGVLGAISWLLYLLLSTRFHMEIAAVFVPALSAALLSKLLSVRRKCPITIFLSTSIFPLLPGLSFYQAVYFLITGTPGEAGTYILNCFNAAFAIALSIILVQELRLPSSKKHTTHIRS